MDTCAGYRYERKYHITGLTIDEIQSLLTLHPAVYHTAYPPRFVNSVYFDTPILRNCTEHSNGVQQRKKIRIRWYGACKGLIEKPMLEVKMKCGDVGTKYLYPLGDIRVEKKNIDWQVLVKSGTVPSEVSEMLMTSLPWVQIRYFRYYYISGDQQCRLTVDTGIGYEDLNSATNFRWYELRYPHSTVVELKYDSHTEVAKYSVEKLLKARITSYSKYLEGIGYIFCNELLHV